MGRGDDVVRVAVVCGSSDGAGLARELARERRIRVVAVLGSLQRVLPASGGPGLTAGEPDR